MRRLFWLGVGLALGALVFRKLNQTAQRLTPRNMAQSTGSALAELTQAVQDFAAEVRENMREREVELREGAGLDAGDVAPAGLPGGTATR
jgi:flagellar motor switch protein FliM